MEEMFKNIASPAWWMGVVIVGILINLAAAYLKPRLDQAASFVSLRWATRTEEQRRQRLERIKRLRGNVNEQLFASFDGLRVGIWALILLVLATNVGLASQLEIHFYGVSLLRIFAFLGGVLGTFLALRNMRDFGRIGSEISEARRAEDRHDQANA